jgi:hypothetical protein
MGYTLELWASDIDGLLSELRSATIDPSTIDDDTGLVDQLIDIWPSLASTVSEAIASGGGEIGDELALYVVAVVRARGHFYGALAHTSSGGDDFRSRFLPGPVAVRFGRQHVIDLINRSVDGLTWAEYPVVGYLTAAELADALAIADQAGPLDDTDSDDETGAESEDIDDIHTMETAMRRATRFGLDLVAIYV